MFRSFLTICVLLLSFTSAYAACAGGACFWIGGTGTLNLTSDSAHWSTTSGGTTCSCEPGTSDAITFDGSSGGGTVTVNVPGGWAAASITMGAFTGTLDFATNNNNVALTSSFNGSGTGTRTLNMGNGTWTILSPGGSAWFMNVTTGLTFNANNSTLVFSGSLSGNNIQFWGGNLTYHNMTVSTTGNGFLFYIINANTFALLTVTTTNILQFQAGMTQTITTFTNVVGSTSFEVLLQTSDATTARGTISSANNWLCSFCAFSGMAFSGGGTFTATTSFDFGNNTGITITGPSAGGGGGSHILGGGI